MNRKQPEVAAWTDIAEEDLVAAGVLFRDDCDTYARNACFLCQQSAEKYLKAVLTAEKMQVPKIHNLPKLTLALRSVLVELDDFKEDIAWLSGFAVEARYPSFSGMPVTRNDAERARAIAERIKLICEHHLQQHE